jgi:hypothetical protein
MQTNCCDGVNESNEDQRPAWHTQRRDLSSVPGEHGRPCPRPLASSLWAAAAAGPGAADAHAVPDPIGAVLHQFLRRCQRRWLGHPGLVQPLQLCPMTQGRVHLQRAKAQRKQDRKYHRSIGHLAKFERQLKAAEASINKLCDGHKNALLALSVKQVHSGKLTVNKLAALRVQPIHYIADKDLYVKELDEACTLYYKAFLKHWTEADSTVVDNLILHYVYDPQSYCDICEKVFCDYRANRAFDDTECELYAVLCGVSGLTSDLRAGSDRFINSLFPLPLLQNEKGSSQWATVKQTRPHRS